MYAEKFQESLKLVEAAREKNTALEPARMTAKQKDYFRKNHAFEDFKPGLKIIGGKLQPVHVPGGVILRDVDFTLN